MCETQRKPQTRQENKYLACNRFSIYQMRKKLYVRNCDRNTSILGNNSNGHYTSDTDTPDLVKQKKERYWNKISKE